MPRHPHRPTRSKRFCGRSSPLIWCRRVSASSPNCRSPWEESSTAPRFPTSIHPPLPPTDPPAAAAESAASPPRDSMESLLAGAFGEILGLPQTVSIHEDFFAALGGDSLRAAQLVTRLRHLTPST